MGLPALPPGGPAARTPGDSGPPDAGLTLGSRDAKPGARHGPPSRAAAGMRLHCARCARAPLRSVHSSTLFPLSLSSLPLGSALLRSVPSRPSLPLSRDSLAPHSFPQPELSLPTPSLNLTAWFGWAPSHGVFSTPLFTQRPGAEPYFFSFSRYFPFSLTKPPPLQPLQKFYTKPQLVPKNSSWFS